MAKNSQKFIADINKLYQDYILGIEKNRSHVNIFNPQNLQSVNKFVENNLAQVSAKIKTESEPQESRCHTFYRIIGFPVVSNDFEIYSPGHDIVISGDVKEQVNNKIKITNNPVVGFKTLSQRRETYLSEEILPIFSKQNIESSVLALVSTCNSRRLNITIQDIEDPLNMDYNFQGYNMDLKTENIDYTQYTSANGTNVDTSKISFKRFHILMPFIVDGRIDLTTPGVNRIAVPFVDDASQLKLTQGVTLQRPLIEKVILERFNDENQIAKLGDSDKELIDRVKQLDSIKDEALLKQIFSGDIYNLKNLQFIKFLDMIVALTAELVNLQFKVSKIQSEYYYVPEVSVTGPEGGCKTKGLFIKDPNSLRTKADTTLFNFQVRSIIDSLNMPAHDTSKEPDKGGFALPPFTTTFNSDNSDAMGNTLKDTFDKLKDKRVKELDIANDALRQIEIITGEFSGLGLVDIIAIMASLYIIDKKYLLGFIDSRAYERMNKNPAIKTSESQPGIVETLTEFTKTVRGFYDIIDKVYEDVQKNNGNY